MTSNVTIASPSEELRKKFEKQIKETKEMLQEIMQFCLKIMIWGPGRKSDRAFNCRRRVAKELGGSGRPHVVLFSDNLKMKCLDQKTVEVLHSKNFDMIIILTATWRSLTRIFQEVSDEKINPRIWVYAPQSPESNFTGKNPLESFGEHQGNVNYFQISDLKGCRILEQIKQDVISRQSDLYNYSKSHRRENRINQARKSRRLVVTTLMLLGLLIAFSFQLIVCLLPAFLLKTDFLLHLTLILLVLGLMVLGIILYSLSASPRWSYMAYGLGILIVTGSILVQSQNTILLWMLPMGWEVITFATDAIWEKRLSEDGI